MLSPPQGLLSGMGTNWVLPVLQLEKMPDPMTGTQQAGPGITASWHWLLSLFTAPSPSSSSSQSRCHSAIHSTCWGYGIKQDRQGPFILGEEAVSWQEPRLAGEAPSGDRVPSQWPGPGSPGWVVQSRSGLNCRLALTVHRSVFPPRTVIRINIPGSPFLGSYSPCKKKCPAALD